MTGHRRAVLLAAALLAASLALAAAASAGPAAEAAPFPAAPESLARAAALRTLPCAGEDAVDGFAPVLGVPPAWRVAGALISVRRAGPDRFAFVLDPPATDAASCAVRDVVVLPRRGELLACALPDHSSPGIGVHTRLASGRRDLVFWRGDGAGGLQRRDPEAGGLDADALICALPDAMP